MTQADRNSVYNPNADLHGLIKVGFVACLALSPRNAFGCGQRTRRRPSARSGQGMDCDQQVFVLAARTMPWPIVGQSIQGAHTSRAHVPTVFGFQSASFHDRSVGPRFMQAFWQRNRVFQRL